MMKFYRCNKCGNVIMFLHDSGVVPVCCGDNMVEIIPQEMEEMLMEKHVPHVNINGQEVMVSVGEVLHPMVKEHYIEWIILETTNGAHIIRFNENSILPITKLTLEKDEEVLAAYEYCNIHGLWIKRIKQ